MSSLHKITHMGDVLEVFDDHITMNSSLLGTKTIPYQSVREVLFEKPGLVRPGFLGVSVVREEGREATHPLRPGRRRLARDGGGGEVAFGVALPLRLGLSRASRAASSGEGAS